MREGIPNPRTIIERVLCECKVQDADDVAARISRSLRMVMFSTSAVYIRAGQEHDLEWCYEPEPGE